MLKKITVVLLLSMSFFLTSCSKKIRIFSAKEAVDALSVQAAKVQTVKGRAWVTAHSSDNKGSFPAIIAIDRTNPKKPLMRIEATDPFGATHALLILDKNMRFSWTDFDAKDTMSIKGNWHGIPLSRLPDLLIGISTLPEEGVVSSATEDSFEVRASQLSMVYLMSWIDPGPMLALNGINAEVDSIHKEKYIVQYSHYLDKADLYLPQDVELSGYRGSIDKPQIEVKVNWRERKWNEPLSPDLFVKPNLK
jgi:hypothetical protein